MPITASLGALSYSRNIGLGYPVANAWITVQSAINNIQPGSIIPTTVSADIQVDSTGEVLFGYNNDTWTVGNILKLSANGIPASAIQSSLLSPNSLSSAEGFIDSSGNIYGSGDQTIQVGGNYWSRIWVAKMDNTRTVFWRNVYYATSASNHWSNGIKLGSDGYLYITGVYNWAPPNSSAFLMKLNTDGTLQWVKGLSNGGAGYQNIPIGFDIDSSNNVYTICSSTNGNYYMTKFDSSGNVIANIGFTSGIPSGVCCSGNYVFVAIDNGFIKFNSSLNVVDQKSISGSYSNIGLEQVSQFSRKITVDASGNIYYCFPSTSYLGTASLYLVGLNSSYNLLFCNTIQTTPENSYSTYQTSPTISGIKYYPTDNRLILVFRALSSGTNYMWVSKLPADGTIPIGGNYQVGNQGFFYSKFSASVTTPTYGINSNGANVVTPTFTTATATTGSGSTGGGWSSIKYI